MQCFRSPGGSLLTIFLARGPVSRFGLRDGLLEAPVLVLSSQWLWWGLLDFELLLSVDFLEAPFFLALAARLKAAWSFFSF